MKSSKPEQVQAFDELVRILNLPQGKAGGEGVLQRIRGMVQTQVTAQGWLAWFKNARFRVTLGISARTLIGPALERVYATPG